MEQGMSRGDGFKVWDIVKENPALSWEFEGQEHATHLCHLAKGLFGAGARWEWTGAEGRLP